MITCPKCNAPVQTGMVNCPACGEALHLAAPAPQGFALPTQVGDTGGWQSAGSPVPPAGPAVQGGWQAAAPTQVAPPMPGAPAQGMPPPPPPAPGAQGMPPQPPANPGYAPPQQGGSGSVGGVLGGFFKDLKSSLGDAAQMGKDVVNKQRAPQGQGMPPQGGQPYNSAPMPPQGSTPPAAPQMEAYPNGLPNAPSPVQPGGAAETVLLRGVSAHIYPNGAADHGMAVLTNYRLAYFQIGGAKAAFGGVSAKTQGKFMFDLPLATIARVEQEMLPHPGKGGSVYPFLVLYTADDRRFPLHFDNPALWRNALQTETSRAAEAKQDAEAAAGPKASGAPEAPEKTGTPNTDEQE